MVDCDRNRVVTRFSSQIGGLRLDLKSIWWCGLALGIANLLSNQKKPSFLQDRMASVGSAHVCARGHYRRHFLEKKNV